MTINQVQTGSDRLDVLAVDDEPDTVRMLEVLLKRWDYRVSTATNGKQAWAKLEQPDAPRLVVLDWMLPDMDGIEICRRLRGREQRHYTYVILLTARDAKADMSEGFRAGADDFITKPFDHAELRMRVRAGERIIRLESDLAAKVQQLEETVSHVARLHDLLPICMHCGRVRDDQKVWHRLEAYVHEHAGTRFSHGLCEQCASKYYTGDDTP